MSNQNNLKNHVKKKPDYSNEINFLAEGKFFAEE